MGSEMCIRDRPCRTTSPGMGGENCGRRCAVRRAKSHRWTNVQVSIYHTDVRRLLKPLSPPQAPFTDPPVKQMAGGLFRVQGESTCGRNQGGVTDISSRNVCSNRISRICPSRFSHLGRSFETDHVRETDRRCIARNPSGHIKKGPKQKSARKSKYP